MSTGDVRVVYVRVPESLHRQLRVRAGEEDRTYTEVMIDALKMYLEKKGRVRTG